MKQLVKKSFLLGLGAASLTKKQAEKVVRNLVKRNAVTAKEGKQMLIKIKNAAKSETTRLRKFAEQEAKKIARNLGSKSADQFGKLKKKLKAVERELSSKGKNTLKRILNQLSK